MAIITTERLSKCYGRRLALDQLSLDVREGELFGFLGPNGSGKTTTIRLLLGLLRPTSGAGRVFSSDCWCQSPAIKSQVGYLPGDLHLYSWLSCRRAARVFGQVRRRDLWPAMSGLAEEFRLDPDLLVRQMSRGTKQKLGLILALAHEPKLLILDEPSTALDPLIQEKLFMQLRSMVTRGHTVFFSSHTLSEVERLCDRIAVLREGRMVANETLAALRAGAPRNITITWLPGREPDAPPPFLTTCQRNGRQWQATLQGNSADFVRWCAGQPLEDVSIGAPDLSNLFRAYYNEAEAAP